MCSLMFLSCLKLFYWLSSLNCIFACTYQANKTAALAICTQEWHFPFSPGWWKGASSGAVDFYISWFYIHFYTYKLVDVQCYSSEKHCAQKQTGKSAWVSMYTYTQSQDRQASLALIKFYLGCAAGEENISAISEHSEGAAHSGDGGTTEIDKLKFV